MDIDQLPLSVLRAQRSQSITKRDNLEETKAWHEKQLASVEQNIQTVSRDIAALTRAIDALTDAYGELGGKG